MSVTGVDKALIGIFTYFGFFPKTRIVGNTSIILTSQTPVGSTSPMSFPVWGSGFERQRGRVCKRLNAKVGGLGGWYVGSCSGSMWEGSRAVLGSDRNVENRLNSC